MYEKLSAFYLGSHVIKLVKKRKRLVFLPNETEFSSERN